jgi:hypothetical protein
MRIVRYSALAIFATFFLSLSSSVFYSRVVKPIQTQILISKGCNAYSKIATYSKPTSAEVDSISHYFGKLARLDPKYVQIAAAVDGYWTSTNTQNYSENLRPQFIRDTFILYSFCAK